MLRAIAQHRTIGAEDANPVDVYALPLGHVPERELAPRFGAVRRQNLRDLSQGVRGAPVSLEPGGGVLEEEHVILTGVRGGVYAEGVNRIAGRGSVLRLQQQRKQHSLHGPKLRSASKRGQVGQKRRSARPVGSCRALSFGYGPG